jgi:hypothetical protein
MNRSLLLRLLSGLTHQTAAVLAECRYAQRRMAVLQTAPDRFTVERPNAAPDSYAEFLFRTSGVLLHEPSARLRARGGPRAGLRNRGG